MTVAVRVKRAYGTCSVCELQSRVWEAESIGALLCGICLRLLVAIALEDMTQPS